MIKLKSVDKFVIKDRGTVYAIEGVPGLNGRSLLGQLVVIDDTVREVVGVERPGLNLRWEEWEGREFGLLVKDDEPSTVGA